MRAVAAALVLIVGAAVVLWYGNTLNSWVLGGLIGGLAALLLSIPISLTIFSFLARRHDEQLRANADLYEEEYDYPRVPEQVVRSMYVVAEDRPRSRREVWEEEEEWDEGDVGDEEEDLYRRTDAVRRVQEPPRLPAPGQQKAVPGLPAPRRNAPRSKQLPASTKPLERRTRQLSAREREITSRRPAPQRMNNTSFPGAEVPQSQMRSQALRTARLEAARQREEDAIEELPSYRPRRSPIVRPSKPLPMPQDEEQIVSRSTQQGAKHYPRRPRHIVDTSPAQDDVPLTPVDNNTTWQPPRRQRAEPETEYIDAARPDGDAEPKRDLKSSLVRRAPYMYEDDPLRKQLSQQVDGPITRRSSRNLATPQDEK